MLRIKQWRPIPILFGPAVLTEKIDGYPVSLHIDLIKLRQNRAVTLTPGDVAQLTRGGRAVFYRVWVQYRNRPVTLDKDLKGVAAWARQNAAGLSRVLGPGVHMGEWWGYKINRGYGLPRGERRLSLYNTARWSHVDGRQVPGLYSMPVLWEGDLGQNWSHIVEVMDKLQVEGSRAVPGYRYPQGAVLYHQDANVMMMHLFKNEVNRKPTPARSSRAHVRAVAVTPADPPKTAELRATEPKVSKPAAEAAKGGDA